MSLIRPVMYSISEFSALPKNTDNYSIFVATTVFDINIGHHTGQEYVKQPDKSLFQIPTLGAKCNTNC